VLAVVSAVPGLDQREQRDSDHQAAAECRAHKQPRQERARHSLRPRRVSAGRECAPGARQVPEKVHGEASPPDDERHLVQFQQYAGLVTDEKKGDAGPEDQGRRQDQDGRDETQRQ